jgi:hypothetical protein
MKTIILTLALATLMAFTACGNNPVAQEKKSLDARAKEERQAVSAAIHNHADDFQQVEIIGNTVVYTHIFDGILDIKTYTYDNDTCVEAERVYVFPDQMSALRHYRRAIEHAKLYDDIQLLKNEVKYNLKQEQYELETKGLTKEQLKTKFEDQMKAAKADFSKAKKDCCKDGCKKSK